MKTFEEWKTTLERDLDSLKRFERPWTPAQLKYALQEKELGRHCFGVEEQLSARQVQALKKALGIKESAWQMYKSKFIHSTPESD